MIRYAVLGSAAAPRPVDRVLTPPLSLQIARGNNELWKALDAV